MKTKAFLLIAVLAFVTGGIIAQENTKFVENRNNSPLMNIPDLTEDQADKIKDMKTIHMKEMIPLRNSLKEKEAELQTVSTGENIQLETIFATIDEIGKIKIQMAKKHAQFKYDVRNILTEDQRVYFDTYAPKKMHHKKKMMHKKQDMDH